MSLSSRDPFGPVLEARSHRISQLFFDRAGESDRLDLVLAETFLRPLRELPAEAGVIDAAPAHERMREHAIKLVLLLVERLVLHLDDQPRGVADLFVHPDRGEIARAADVDAGIERVLRIAEKIECPDGFRGRLAGSAHDLELIELVGLIFAARDQIVAEESAGIVARHAHVFLEETFLIGRARALIS